MAIALACGLPILFSGVASAYAKGTCFVKVQGQKEKIGPCQKVAKGVIPASKLKHLDRSKCYAISAGLSSQSIVPTNCDGKGKAGTVVTGTDGCAPNGQFEADPAVCGNSQCKDAEHCDLTTKYVNPIINKFLAPLAILAVIIGIIWGSIQYTTSGGDSQKVAEAKGKIQKALLALVVFIFLYALLNWLMPGGLLPKGGS